MKNIASLDTKKLTDKSKLTRSELIFLIVVAIVTITVVSSCSPLYPFNPWDDTNCFFTMGRGIIHGLVPYRDLYEQKGPLLYYIFAAAALISDKSFTGVWLIECAAAAVFAVYSWKTAKLFTVPSGFTIFLVPVLLGITYTIKMFNFGGNAEELCFPLLSVAFYFALRSIVINGKLPSNSEALICGIITGILFWIKYTLIGFIVGFVICILFLAVKNKEFINLWSMIWRFTIGFLLVTAPVLIYFLANGSLAYLWEAYFYNNIFLYLNSSQPEISVDTPVIKHLIIPMVCLVWTSLKYPSFGIVFLLSIISPIFVTQKNRKKLVIIFYVTLFFSSVFIFTKLAVLYYYGYILSYCFALTMIPFIRLLNKISNLKNRQYKFFSFIISMFLVGIFLVSICNCKNQYLLLKHKDYLPQFRIAKTIKQTPDAKILTYDVMDSGFYTASGLLPQNRFFCFLNIESDYAAILEEQNKLINAGYFDYIVTTYNCECEWEKYELIQQETGQFVDQYGSSFTDGYKLYKRL